MQGFRFYADTDPQALEVFLRLQRERSAADKLADVFALNDLVRGMIEADLRRQYPEASDREIFLRCAVRYLGRETVRKVYGWDEGCG